MKLTSHQPSDSSEHLLEPRPSPAVEFCLQGLTLTARIAGGAGFDIALASIRGYRMPVTVVEFSAADGLSPAQIDALVDLWRALRRRACELRIVAHGAALQSLAEHRLGAILPVFTCARTAASAPPERAA